MADNFYGFDDSEGEEKKDNLFLWTIFILLLVGVAAACWMGSFYIFSNPQDPRWYPLLRKIKKIDAPKRFEATAAPPGEFLSPGKLFEKYSKYTRLELQNENRELLVNYLRNFRETKKLTPYMTGKFTIMDSYELKPSDMFGSGIVAVAQADDFAQVLIEHVYPAAPEVVPVMKEKIQTGVGMTLVRSNDLAAIVHIEKIPDGRLQFTLVPLLYGVYAGGSFGLQPPADLNMKGGVPITKPEVLKNVVAKYADWRRQNPTPEPTENSPAPPKQELVRLDTVEPGSKVPESGTLPAMPISTPIPIAGQPTPHRLALATPAARIPVATPLATPAKVAMLATPSATPRPAATPIAPFTPVPVPTATPAVAQTSPSGVPLKPFLSAAPSSGTMPTVPGATWRTYAPGRTPAGRAISVTEAAQLAGRGEVGERLYLQGDFRVTASGETRAVMRDRSAGGDTPSPLDGVRIIVDFPAGAVPPGENAVVSRDPSRPYEVREIRKGLDGQVNILVREIVSQ